MRISGNTLVGNYYQGGRDEREGLRNLDIRFRALQFIMLEQRGSAVTSNSMQLT